MTELEISVTNWLAKALELPAEFLNTDNGPGLGIIQSTASNATYMAILAARGQAIEVPLIRTKMPLNFDQSQLPTTTSDIMCFFSALKYRKVSSTRNCMLLRMVPVIYVTIRSTMRTL